jgi:site-specific DNA-methyltransferase (adenine-specific)
MSTAIRPSSEPNVAEKLRAKSVAFAARPDILNSHHRLFLGDAREMTQLSVPGSVQLVVTSPPYWTLKKYDGAAGPLQLGHLDDYREFRRELGRVWERCFELLVAGGRLVVVVGDVCLSRKKAGRHFVVPIHADIIRQCIKIGFDYLTPILWYKIANATTEVEGNGSPFLGKPYEPNAIIKNDVEYILIFRKPGGYRNPTSLQRTLSVIEKEDHAKWFRAIWADVPGQNRLRGHPAPFPVELAYRLINMFSFVGDTVLDPFVGTGSTTVAAQRAYRSSVGFEIEPTYLDTAMARIHEELGLSAINVDVIR